MTTDLARPNDPPAPPSHPTINGVPNELRTSCNDLAIDSFGTGRIFETRARRKRRDVRLLLWLGIAPPLAVGGTVITFTASNPHLELAITIAGALGAIQVLVVVWSLAARWDDDLAYAMESKVSNYRLAKELRALAADTSLNANAFQLRHAALKAEQQAREDADNKYDITEAEKHMGMRAALREYQRRCASCKAVPMDLNPIDCPVCGRFPRSLL